MLLRGATDGGGARKVSEDAATSIGEGPLAYIDEYR